MRKHEPSSFVSSTVTRHTAADEVEAIHAYRREKARTAKARYTAKAALARPITLPKFNLPPFVEDDNG